MNQRSQYGLAGDGWSRVLVPNGEDAIAVTHFDPKATPTRWNASSWASTR
jgi:hypothetical protein